MAFKFAEDSSLHIPDVATSITFNDFVKLAEECGMAVETKDDGEFIIYTGQGECVCADDSVCAGDGCYVCDEINSNRCLASNDDEKEGDDG